MLDVSPMRIRRQCLGAALDFLERHGHVAPHIDTNIDRVPASHPLVVDVAKQVQCALPCPVPCDHRIVAQDRGRATTIGNLCQMCHRGPRQHLGGFAIMVANHQMLFCTGQFAEQLFQPVEILCLLAEGKVAYDPCLLYTSDAADE